MDDLPDPPDKGPALRPELENRVMRVQKEDKKSEVIRGHIDVTPIESHWRVEIRNYKGKPRLHGRANFVNPFECRHKLERNEIKSLRVNI